MVARAWFAVRQAACFAARWIVGVGLCLLMPAAARAALATDVTVFTNRSNASTSITSPSFSTAASGELLLAFVASDATAPGMSVSSMTGAGLTWVLVRRTNAQLGTAEVWRAFAPAPLSGVSVRANLAQGVAASMSIVSFTGADATGSNGSGAIGANASASAGSGAPTATLVTTRDNAWVFGVGNDYDNAVARTVPGNQVMINQYLATVGDTYWLQREATPTASAGTSVTLNDTAPTADRFNLTAVEVLPALPTNPTYTVSGSIAPAALGVGTTVALSQGAVTLATTTADASGNYRFTSVANGAYTVTPAKTGVTFAPPSQGVTVNGAPVTVAAFAATSTAPPTYTVSGSITPAALGAGTVVALTQSATLLANATADANGRYAFTGVANGAYVVTPSKSGVAFAPASMSVTVNGQSVAVPAFSASTTSTVNLPDLSVVIPTGRMSVVGTGASRVFQYTHDTFNGGAGPLVIQPAYNAASGVYLGTQYVYSLSGTTWTLAQQIPVAGAFVFDVSHGHFHFPFVTFGLYAVAANGGPGAVVALSQKDGFCIDDSFIYAPNLPNAGALGNLGACTDPTSLRGLDIGAVDEYDQSDPGQSISLVGVPDGNYWLRAIADPENFLVESDKSNNETDVLVNISGSTVTELQRMTPVLPPPPVIMMTAPADQSTVTGTVNLMASPPAGAANVQFLLDGQALGAPVPAPYTLAWDSTTIPNGASWLAVQTTDAVSGRTGTSSVVRVTVANGGTRPPIVTVTSPDPGTTVSAITALSATVAATSAVASVQFYVDGLPAGGPLTTAPYLLYWDSRTVSNAAHVLTASATDAFGLVGTSPPLNFTVDNAHPASVITIDALVAMDGAGTMTTPAFSTTTASDLLVAFVAYDGPETAAETATVSGAGQTWSLVMRSNTQLGTSEIWVAKPTTALSNVTVSSKPAASGYHGTLVVIGFINATGVGITGRAGAITGAPDIYLPGVSAGNWVFAVGNDWDSAIPRTPVAGQVLVHQRVDTGVGDTYWVQATATPSTANALVDIHDNAPTTDEWNYAAVEIVAARP